MNRRYAVAFRRRLGAVQPGLICEAIPPEFGGVPVGADSLGGPRGGHASGHKQDEAAALDDLLRCSVGLGPICKLGLGVGGEFERCWARHADTIAGTFRIVYLYLRHYTRVESRGKAPEALWRVRGLSADYLPRTDGGGC